MKKVGSWIAFAALGAALITTWFFRDQNRKLIQDLEVTRREKPDLNLCRHQPARNRKAVVNPIRLSKLNQNCCDSVERPRELRGPKLR
jgi:hypothetical protein